MLFFNPLHTFLFHLSIFHSSFRKYLDCSEFVTRRTCGMETGLFIRDFIHRMSDTLMRNYCEEYYKGSNHCSNEFSSASLKNSSSAILFTFVGISIAIQRNSWKNFYIFFRTCWWKRFPLKRASANRRERAK